MKVLTIVIVALFLIMSAMPVFAAKAKNASSSDTQQQVSIFQRASDDISGICKDSPDRTTDSVAIFQKSYDEAAEGAPGAQGLSLRENKSELVKRRKGTPNILVPGVF